jgi:hypothetical protein
MPTPPLRLGRTCVCTRHQRCAIGRSRPAARVAALRQRGDPRAKWLARLSLHERTAAAWEHRRAVYSPFQSFGRCRSSPIFDASARRRVWRQVGFWWNFWWMRHALADFVHWRVCVARSRPHTTGSVPRPRARRGQGSRARASGVSCWTHGAARRRTPSSPRGCCQLPRSLGATDDRRMVPADSKAGAARADRGG